MIARGSTRSRISDLWAYRDVFAVLLHRDIALRYRQTVFGVTWAVLPAVLTAGLFAAIFGRFARLSEGQPYFAFALAGIIPWHFFNSAVLQSSNSLVAGQNVLGKVYFPRLLMPLSSMGSAVIDAGIGFLLVTMIVAVTPASVHGHRLLVLPAYLLLLVITAAGVGAGLAALNAVYRDVRHALPFVLQLWMFATPVIYPLEIVPPPWSHLIALNPLTAITQGVRAGLISSPPPSAPVILEGLAVALLLAWGGLSYFRKVESTLADVV